MVGSRDYLLYGCDEMTDIDGKEAAEWKEPTVESLRQQLAECQAREKVLRDAFACHINASTIYSITDDVRIAQEALALPSDSTALETMLKAAKREALLEAASAIEKDADRVGTAWVSGLHADTIRRMAKELE